MSQNPSHQYGFLKVQKLRESWVLEKRQLQIAGTQVTHVYRIQILELLSIPKYVLPYRLRCTTDSTADNR
eukprot:6445340-Ditylum_brightwellii.AAC.1